ncbi:hypothetical protein SAMN04488483_1393 [Pseudomonas helmanticensis]|uniref:Uncharacterized protein n=1 Tax=Pseudomonas helmanticensis TaxID=1471381 RepID=A0ACD2U2R4_9PSED|nr:hypothetical protein SAMN04488483_1393 [Pseudomonas helmanticensis]
MPLNQRSSMGAIKFCLGILLLFCNADFSYRKPRRVFTTGFVCFCMVVAVTELLILTMIYYPPR